MLFELQRIGKVLDVFTNYDKKSKCVDYKKGSDYGNLDASGWDYQVRTFNIAFCNSRIFSEHIFAKNIVHLC